MSGSWYGVFDLRQRRHEDGTPYVAETLIKGAVYETRGEAEAALEALKEDPAHEWRQMGVRKMGLADLKPAVWASREKYPMEQES